ncbi:hypothetical protein Tsubulata_017747 [Turnera subulata]|uniref:Uncharacterized protein n=1 Tax=Turnera subulata TaxID=218843 RepID=A0A9Q0GIU9_9ROSI|nr:hypothetical protein Tsubulata_017747 [Turnera subulata]
MKRQPPSPYADSNMNSYGGSQMQHQVSGQRMRHNQPGVGNFSGRPDSYPAEADHPYKSSKVEGQWHWDRDAQSIPNQMPSHGFHEGKIEFADIVAVHLCMLYLLHVQYILSQKRSASQGGNGTRSYYHGQTPDPKLGTENQVNNEARAQPHEQDMEVGYEDNLLPLSFEGLERKFHDDVMRLAKEHNEAEDAENVRHRDKIIEINTRYQEKLSALRAQQANRREEFLRKESQARLTQYQQAGMSTYPSTGLQDARGYSGTAVAGAAAEAHQSYPTSQFDSYRDRPQFAGGGRTQGTEGRVPYPEGRVYNNAGGRYY